MLSMQYLSQYLSWQACLQLLDSIDLNCCLFGKISRHSQCHSLSVIYKSSQAQHFRRNTLKCVTS